MNKSRPKSVNFRLSLSEYSQLQERIKNSEMSLQEFLLRSALDKPLVPKTVYQELLSEIRRQGVNLNQIARACNLGNVAEEKERLNEVLKKLEELWQSLKL